MKEYGRDVRFDAESETKLVQASLGCKWRARTRELFRDIVALMRDTGMRNERELFQIRIQNLDWNNWTIFVPVSKTPEGRRLVPMSRRVFDILKKRCWTRTEGWVFPSKRSASGHLRSICNWGHRHVRTAMHYQHPELEIVRAALDYDYGAAADIAETGA